MKIQATTLQGDFIRLEPIQEHHLQPLSAVVQDGDLWRIPVTSVPHPDQLDAFYQDAKKAQEQGTALVFVTCLQATGAVVGSTRFMHINAAHHRLEIGFTFIAKSWQRSPVNTEAKWLMLNHAFEQLGANRVEFLTHSNNHQSRTAIKRLGATEEGLLRQHMIMGDGQTRDSVIFGITRSDWPEVKATLYNKRNPTQNQT